MIRYISLKDGDRISILKSMLSVLILSLFVFCSAFSAQAKPKLSTKKVTLVSGKMKKVKLKGAKGETTWTSSNLNVGQGDEEQWFFRQDRGDRSRKAKITAKNRERNTP